MAAWIVQGPGFHPSTDQSCTQIGKKVGDSSVGKVLTRQEDLPAFRKPQHPHERQAGWGVLAPQLGSGKRRSLSLLAGQSSSVAEV